MYKFITSFLSGGADADADAESPNLQIPSTSIDPSATADQRKAKVQRSSNERNITDGVVTQTHHSPQRSPTRKPSCPSFVEVSAGSDSGSTSGTPTAKQVDAEDELRTKAAALPQDRASSGSDSGARGGESATADNCSQMTERPKTTSGASGGDASDDARIEALEAEIHALRSEVAPLRQQLLRSNVEAMRLRLQLQQFQVNHEALPVSTLTTTVVDLSRVDTNIIAQISSFVGTSRELLNLALTCKSFGWQQPTSPPKWSIAEEVARQTVRSGQNDIDGVRITLPQYAKGMSSWLRTTLPQYATITWLKILHESERPLKFDTVLGSGIELSCGKRTLITDEGDITGTAIASNYVMESGIHFAEFSIVGGRPYLGIVRPIPNLDPYRFSDDDGHFHFMSGHHDDYFMASRTDEWGTSNVHACEYNSSDGSMNRDDWEGDIEHDEGLDWEGMESCEGGDTIGMLLNLDSGTLSVYKNDRRLGVMKDGLSGSYCCELGKHIDDIVGQLSKKGYSEMDVRNAIAYLSNEGHIYSTIDEDHYKFAE
ncbi:hypothetical protein THAOC_28285 [Thalassiosira oceanica]|uniref:Replication protein A C-terminal domain-containing protein n=1 Tax=Thalassiosira oceanica TaxID=159749 RepID=K0S0L2_THAOC|nr:hypothetical protein THAOC_28285 [Thalassiosira oceanica]|eukprot:EJK52437.1 hypothetical protein THAOC_28285 [Thalassiosira oceanica]